jgi:2-dehydropantoate 2-reductase
MGAERVVIVGAGAVGCYFGGMLARAGIPVILIGRAPHVDAIRKDGLFLQRKDFEEYVRVDASTDITAVRQGTIVLLCVKTIDTESAAAALAPYVGPDAVVVSFQNGVDNAERIQRAIGIPAIPAVVYVACAMTGPGRVTHNGRGDIVIGPRSVITDRISGLFNAAQIPCRVSQNIDGELWTKLLMNCAYNAVSAITHSQYRALKEDTEIQNVMKELIREVVDVGTAAGVVLPNAEQMIEAATRLGESMADATSSTEQDLGRGRPTEMDSLNGYIVRRGRELGVSTPVNTTVYALVKLIERQSQKANR